VNGAATTLTFDQSGVDATISNVITGDGSVAKSGTAGLTLTEANTYTGGTTINAGTLTVGNATALGTGNVTVGNGQLRSTVNFSTPGTTFIFAAGATSTVSAAAGTTLTIAPASISA